MAPWGACAKLEASKGKSTNQWVTSWLIYRWCKHFKEAIVRKYQLVKLAHSHQLINHLQPLRFTMRALPAVLTLVLGAIEVILPRLKPCL